MKKLFTILALSALSAALFAAEMKISNKTIELRYNSNCEVEVYPRGAKKPIATISVNLKKDTLKAYKAVHNERNVELLSLRGPDGSIGFKLEKDTPTFVIAFNQNASPVTVKWNASAVVIPDIFAEDEVVLPSDSPRALPHFAPLYLALIDGGNATVSCMPVKAKSPAMISGDLDTLTLYQKNNEDYFFCINVAKGAWHQTTLPGKPGEFMVDKKWDPPYPAKWRAAMPVKKDFIPAGDGCWSVWNVVTVINNDRVINSPLRAAMTDKKTRRTWHGGFEGTYRYPAEFEKDKLKLMHPRYPFQRSARFEHCVSRPVFVYAWQPLAGTKVAMPEEFLPPWVAENRQYRSTNSNYGTLSTTCATTGRFERLFYRDEAEEKLSYLKAILMSMQCFVESIRGRIESGREWRLEMLEFGEEQKKLYPEISGEVDKMVAAVNDIERLYQIALDKIKTPPAVVAMSKEVLDLATSKLDEEEKEEISKKLGRAIRVIGGTQDNLAAEIRHVGKCVRYHAVNGYMNNTKNPRAQKFWTEVYRRTEPLLQGYYAHDGK